MTFTNFNSYFILAWDSNAHIGEDPWCTWLHTCGGLFFLGGDSLIEGEKAQELEKRAIATKAAQRYASRHSWNSYPYSISPYICFWIFNILLIGVDEKGHKLICWDWLLTCLPCFGFWFSYVSLLSSEIHDFMLEFDHVFFLKSHTALPPLSPAHGLTFEVELFMFIDQYLPLSSSPGFTSVFLFIYLFSIPLPVWYLNLFEVLTVCLKKCPEMKIWLIPWFPVLDQLGFMMNCWFSLSKD